MQQHIKILLLIIAAILVIVFSARAIKDSGTLSADVNNQNQKIEQLSH